MRPCKGAVAIVDSRPGGCGGAEFIEEPADTVGGAAVSFDLAGPAAFGGVGDESFLGAQPFLWPTRNT